MVLSGDGCSTGAIRRGAVVTQAFFATPFLIDGGISTQLERHGADMHDPLWTARTLLKHPQLIEQAHRDFIDAGADVVITASYQVSRAGFAEAGLSVKDADRALDDSVRIARDAAQGTPVKVAASIGPYGAIAHDGGEYRGNYGLTKRQLRDFHVERIDVLGAAAPDLFAIETIPDLDEIEALADALDGSLPCWVSLTAPNAEHLWSGHALTDAVEAMCTVPGVVAIGVNCTAPEHVPAILDLMRARTDLALLAYPNGGGTWDPSTAQWDAPPQDVGSLAKKWREHGALGVGGCCGTDATMIAEMQRALS